MSMSRVSLRVCFGVLGGLISAAAIGQHIAVAATAAAPSVSVRRITTLDAEVLTGDLNGDGIVDVVTQDIGPGFSEIVAQLGKGDGSFNAPIKTGVQGRALALADVNGDGKIDVIVTGGPVRMLPGRGDGTFGAAVPIGSDDTLDVGDAAVGDFDGDNNPDIAVVVGDEIDNNYVYVFPGHGDGSFSPEIKLFTAFDAASMRPVLADLNGDGRLDIAVANHFVHSVSIFLNQGAFTFSSSTISFDRQANDVAVADVNHDGKADLLVAVTHDGADDLYYIDGAVDVLPGNGDGTFAAPVTYASGRGAWRLVLGDFNRDGVPDVATANRSARQSDDFCGFLWDTVSILPGAADGTFGAASTFSMGDQSRLSDTRFRNNVLSLSATDVNGDHQADLVASWGAIFINQAPDTNWPPKVTATSTPPSSTHTILLEAIASDVDQDALSYRWTDSGGRAIEPTATPCLYTATDTAVHTFTVTVDDHHGHTASSSVTVDFGGTTSPTVAVTKPASGETVAAGQPYTITWTATPSSGATLTQFGLFSSADDGAHWTGIQECASVPGTARSCVWNSPGPATTAARIQIIANDSHAGSASANSGRFIIASQGSGSSLGEGWTHADVGAVGAAGTATFDGFVRDGQALTVSGSGADIWGTADEFHYVWQQVNGDFQIETRVDSLQNVNVWTKAGIMMRVGATDAASPHASIIVSPAKGTAFQRRTAEGGVSVSTAGPAIAAPVWLRMVRVGSAIRAYVQKQPTDPWTFVGEQVFANLASIVTVGLAVTSHADGTVATAKFSGTFLSALPNLFTQVIGGATGNASTDGTTYTVKASGSDIWSASDNFVFVSTPIGDMRQITLRVRSLANTNAWAKAGVMIRETLDAGSRHADFIVSPSKGMALQFRTEPNGPTESIGQTAGGAPVWLRIRRTESTTAGQPTSFTAWHSIDRTIWRAIPASAAFPIAHNAMIGIAVTSHVAGVQTTAVIDDVRIER